MRKGEFCKFRRTLRGANREQYYQPAVFMRRISKTHGVIRIENANGAEYLKTVKLRNVHREINREAA